MSDDILSLSYEEALAHHGVKGMKWGVVKSGDTSSGSSSSTTKKNTTSTGTSGSETTATTKPKTTEKVSGSGSGSSKKLKPGGISDEEMLAYATKMGLDSDSLRAKYGPSSTGAKAASRPKGQNPGELNENSPWYKNLTPEQKTALKYAGAAAAIGGLMYLNYKYGDRLDNLGSPPFMKAYNLTKLRQAKDFKPEDLSTKEVTYGVGHIFKRISTEAETEIRPGGFFAAGEAADVERYKAILPAYWKSWGLDATEGHVVSLKANTEIKSPSPRAIFDYYKSHDAKDEYDFIKSFNPKGKETLDDVARGGFHNWAGGWVREDQSSNVAFFKAMKEQGYNALVDMNDAGALGKQPMRMLDGSLFSISGTERLTKEGIDAARQAMLKDPIIHSLLSSLSLDDVTDREGVDMAEHNELVHALLVDILEDDELTHSGVKGMKWGVRKDKDFSSNQALAGLNKKRRNSAINAARQRVVKQEKAIERQASKTDNLKFQGSAKDYTKAARQLADMENAHLRNPDRATARRMTSGEKKMAIGFAVLMPYGAPFAGGYVIGNRHTRRKIEREIADA